MRKVNRNNRKCGPCPVFEVIPWHLPYNGGKSTEKPPLGYVEHKAYIQLLCLCSVYTDTLYSGVTVKAGLRGRLTWHQPGDPTSLEQSEIWC